MNFIKQKQIMVGAILIILLFASLSLYKGFNNEKTEETDLDWLFENEDTVMDEAIMEVEQTIMVDLKGAVIRPGVYHLHKGSRVIDVINLGGGLLEEADETRVNLAQLLQDEMMIFIPREGEGALEGMVIDMNAGSAGSNGGKIRINHASATELEQLPGIGPARAETIIEYRETNGPFSQVEDLVNVSGIGPKSLEKLKEHITVN
ncbi:helix-hairpin-helix domain-containing protein [Bacillus sp. FJAT-45350]|uniref:helix-hairpin-helix domain-containing protein n=1 Tax=Bacillus sp. FJAT-45350 TaxID=2011014 RepID=UPI000BB67F36|nr:helix-hairpin-helix domain-containing protein [Bacillus sp. FJAT-45350]